MKIYSFLVLFVIALSSCAQNPSGEKGAATVVNLSQEDFKKNYEKVDGLQLLDVRTAPEIAAGKIGEANVLDVFDPEFTEKIAGLNFDKSKPVVIYCKSGGRSSRAAQIFIEQGFKEVYNLTGGYTSY
ncbi:MAG: rhodanese-like domain-containing protein [Crocinitomicaceae bacterium]|jgi:rhodanese-related sulfurtransferase|nr:rhodanese-like domain-containing protein [Crocinitomicaceae bacterium]MDG2463572.1 rhodanese-like domain-containing protein [Crocinitomicaceae bacterium]